MASTFTRDYVIDEGIRRGKSVSQINDALSHYNLGSYNPLTYGKNYANIPANFARNAGEFARDARSVGGAIVSPFISASKAPKGKRAEAVREKFLNAVYSDPFKRTFKGAVIGGTAGSVIPGIGTLGGAILGGVTGLVGGPKSMADAVLSTYNTSVDDIRRGNVDLRDVAQGAFNNPLYSSMDILTLGGGRALGAASKAVAKGVPDTAPRFVQQLLPNVETRAFNRSLTEAKSSSRAKSQELFSGFRVLDAMPNADRLEIVKEITMNNGKLSKEGRELANKLKSDLRAAEKQAVEYGVLDSTLSRNNTVSQYVIGKLLDKLPDVLHNDVMEYLETGAQSERLAKAMSSPETAKIIQDTIAEGFDKYDKGNIAFLTQAISSSKDPLGEVIASEINKTGKGGYFGTKRIIGRTKPEDLAKVLDRSINYQLEEIAKSREAIDVINDILEKPGIGKLLDTDLKELPKGYKAVSKKALKDSIAKQIASGEEVDIARALKRANVASKGAYLVKDLYFDAIKNSFIPTRLGGLKRISSSFKKAVLANPHWIILNRIGNLTNNAIGGVRLSDYLDTIKYKYLIPDRLYQQTSFNSYIGKSFEEGAKLPRFSSVKQPYNRLLRGLDEFKGSEKSLGDIGRLASTFYSSTSDLTANPLFRMESLLERTDRYANFIRQAKREAEVTGKSLKDILKKANIDDGLFNQLNTEVNKDLGDYLGRNYTLPPGYYDALGELVPFYRFLTQTGRTTLHQMANHPLAFQSIVGLPPRAGHHISEYMINQYGLDRDKYKGGVRYKDLPDGQGIRTIGIEPLPAQTVLENLSSLNELPSLVSPIFTMVGDVLRYKKNGEWTPTSPRYIQTKLTNPGDAEKYKPTPQEVASYGLNQLLSTTYNPYRMAGMYVPEAIASITNKGIQSKYDTNIFKENPLSYVRETPAEQIGKWFSLQSQSNYKKRGKTKRNIKKDIATRNRNIKTLKRNMELKK